MPFTCGRCKKKENFIENLSPITSLNIIIFHGELNAGKLNFGRSQLRYRDVCKRDMKELSIDINEREELVTDRSKLRSYLQATLKVGSKKK